MPPQNTEDISQPKSQHNTNGTNTPINGQLSLNNNQEKLPDVTDKLLKPKANEQTPPTTAVIVPPDGGWGWVVMIASFLCNVVVDGIVFNTGPFIDPIRKEYNASTAEVALMASLLTGFYLIAGPFVSGLANKFGFRPITIFGGLLASAAFALSYFANGIIYLYLIYGVLGGIGFCFIYMPSVLTVGYYFEKWRALATGISLCGSGVGTSIWAKVVPILVETYGWKGALLIEAALCLTCCLFALAFRPLKAVQVTVTKDDELLSDKVLKPHEALPVVYTKPLPEGRFAYSVPNSSHNTWMGASNNTTYPTAIEVFRGSGANLERRPSQNSQSNIHSASKKLEQIKSQKRSGHVTPEEITQNPPVSIILTSVHHELTAVGEAEEENENGSLLEKNGVKPVIVAARRHTVSGKRPSTENNSRSNSRRGTLTEANRPLYRDDIFFSGSMNRLPTYQSKTSLGYHLSVTHLPTRNDLEEDEYDRKCTVCPEAVRRTLATMLDTSLLKSPSFLLLAFSGFFTMMGFFVPFVYIAKRATEGGLDEGTASSIVSAIGICNTIARIVCGMLSSFQSVNALHLNNVAITLGGLGTIFSGYLMTAWGQFAYAAVFGVCIACFSALRSILVVELMGLEKLTNAFGILMMFQGIAAVVGSPLAGLIYDLTNSYEASFWVAGGLITLSAVLCYPLNYVSNWEKERALNLKGKKISLS